MSDVKADLKVSYAKAASRKADKSPGHVVGGQFGAVKEVNLQQCQDNHSSTSTSPSNNLPAPAKTWASLFSNNRQRDGSVNVAASKGDHHPNPETESEQLPKDSNHRSESSLPSTSVLKDICSDLKEEDHNDANSSVKRSNDCSYAEDSPKVVLTLVRTEGSAFEASNSVAPSGSGDIEKVQIVHVGDYPSPSSIIPPTISIPETSTTFGGELVNRGQDCRPPGLLQPVPNVPNPYRKLEIRNQNVGGYDQRTPSLFNPHPQFGPPANFFTSVYYPNYCQYPQICLPQPVPTPPQNINGYYFPSFYGSYNQQHQMPNFAQQYQQQPYAQYQQQQQDHMFVNRGMLINDASMFSKMGQQQVTLPLDQQHFGGAYCAPPRVPYQPHRPSGPHVDSWNNAVANMDRENKIREKLGLLINDRYTVINKISMGSYGSIYSARDSMSSNRFVAVKFETYKNETDESHIGFEYEVYKVVSTVNTEDQNARHSIGFPQVFWTGVEFNYRIMVMELLGPSLENLFNYCHRYFSSETIYKLAIQMLDRVEYLHTHGFVHRDLKPDNFLIGIEENEDIVYMIDFGLARRLRTQKVPESALGKGKHLVGTAKYASINSHLGKELSRRDDLESLGYILLEFIKGDLPWRVDDNRPRRRQETYRKMLRGKEDADFKKLCPPLVEWMDYVKQLEFFDDPDYDRLRRCLKNYIVNAPVGRPFLEEFAQLSLTGSRGSSGRHSKNRNRRGQRPNAHLNNPRSPSQSQGSTGGESIRAEQSLEDRLKQSRFEWLQRRESSDNERQTYDCLYGTGLQRRMPVLQCQQGYPGYQ